MQKHLALPNCRRIYMLDTFTVERRPRGWFFVPSGEERNRDAWHGPYGSIASVTLMIARQLMKEITRRDAPYNLD